MIFCETKLAGVVTFEPKIYRDERGYFFESFNSNEFTSRVGPVSFCQDNESLSKLNVIRGLHFQVGENAQSKLVRVVKGAIWDVAVDLRPGSKTFKEWFAVELTERNRKQMFIPSGFAHGFQSLSEETIVQYKVDKFYSPNSEFGIRYDDLELSIAWPQLGEVHLSAKDLKLPSLSNVERLP